MPKNIDLNECGLRGTLSLKMQQEDRICRHGLNAPIQRWASWRIPACVEESSVEESSWSHPFCVVSHRFYNNQERMGKHITDGQKDNNWNTLSFGLLVLTNKSLPSTPLPPHTWLGKRGVLQVIHIDKKKWISRQSAEYAYASELGTAELRWQLILQQTWISPLGKRKKKSKKCKNATHYKCTRKPVHNDTHAPLGKRFQTAEKKRGFENMSFGAKKQNKTKKHHFWAKLGVSLRSMCDHAEILSVSVNRKGCQNYEIAVQLMIVIGYVKWFWRSTYLFGHK